MWYPEMTDALKMWESIQAADRRHAETGNPYLVTAMGHVMWAVKENIALAEECGGIVYTSGNPTR